MIISIQSIQGPCQCHAGNRKQGKVEMGSGWRERHIRSPLYFLHTIWNLTPHHNTILYPGRYNFTHQMKRRVLQHHGIHGCPPTPRPTALMSHDNLSCRLTIIQLSNRTRIRVRIPPDIYARRPRTFLKWISSPNSLSTTVRSLDHELQSFILFLKV